MLHLRCSGIGDASGLPEPEVVVLPVIEVRDFDVVGSTTTSGYEED